MIMMITRMISKMIKTLISYLNNNNNNSPLLHKIKARQLMPRIRFNIMLLRTSRRLETRMTICSSKRILLLISNYLQSSSCWKSRKLSIWQPKWNIQSNSRGVSILLLRILNQVPLRLREMIIMNKNKPNRKELKVRDSKKIKKKNYWLNNSLKRTKIIIKFLIPHHPHTHTTKII